MKLMRRVSRFSLSLSLFFHLKQNKKQQKQNKKVNIDPEINSNEYILISIEFRRKKENRVINV